MKSPDSFIRHGNPDALHEVRDFFRQQLEKLEAKRIDPESFRGHPDFSDGEIDKDLRDLRERKEGFERERKGLDEAQIRVNQNGTLTETVFDLGIASGSILGEKVEIILPSEFDDVFNHVDLIIKMTDSKGEKESEEISFGLAIDFCSNAEEACHKLLETLVFEVASNDKRKTGHSVPTIKYGQGKDKKKVKNMPIAKVIIGAQAGQVADFADSLMSTMVDIDSSSRVEHSIRSLKGHPIRTIVIDEILNQLLAFRNIAHAYKNAEAEDLYRRAYELITKNVEQQNIDKREREIARRGDKIATSLFGLIGGATDSNKTYNPNDLKRIGELLKHQ